MELRTFSLTLMYTPTLDTTTPSNSSAGVKWMSECLTAPAGASSVTVAKYATVFIAAAVSRSA
jgi:hypothetical protein